MYIWNKTCRSPKIFKSSFLNSVLIQRAINKLHLKVNPDWCHHQIIEGITSQSTSRLLDSAFRQIMDHDNSQRNQRRMQRKTFQNKIILVTWSLKSYHQSVIERKESPLNLFFAITRPWKQMISKLSSLLAFSKFVPWLLRSRWRETSRWCFQVMERKIYLIDTVANGLTWYHAISDLQVVLLVRAT